MTYHPCAEEAPVARSQVDRAARRGGGVASMNTARKAAALTIALALAAAGCSALPGGGNTKVKFQLQWVAQSQFAGYYAALDQGYYKDEGLDVSFLLGGPQVDNINAVAAGTADIGTGWLPKMRSEERRAGKEGRARVAMERG